MPISLADFYDTELARLNRCFEAATEIRSMDRVVDVGCGAGQTTRRAAAVAREGFAVGVDISGPLVDEARRRSTGLGLSNCFHVRGDAQTGLLAPARFDLCISRFGVMFFANPAAAFRNLAGSLKPGGRLSLLVWGPRSSNPWADEITEALRPLVPPSGAGAAFSLADVSETTRVLGEAGFVGLDFEAVVEPVLYGATVDDALDAVAALYTSGRCSARDLEAHGPLRSLLMRRQSSRGVAFPSQAWLIRGRTPSGPG